MSLFFKKKKSDVLDTIDSVVDQQKVQQMAHCVVACFQAIRWQWSQFSEPERNILAAWGKRLGGKLVSTGMSLAVMSDGDDVAKKIWSLLQEQKSETMSNFMRTVIEQITGAPPENDNNG